MRRSLFRPFLVLCLLCCLPVLSLALPPSVEMPDGYIFQEGIAVPLAPLAELLKIKVTRQGDACTATQGDHTFTFTLNEIKAVADGRPVKLLFPPFAGGETVFVPLGAFLRAFEGQTVGHSAAGDFLWFYFDTVELRLTLPTMRVSGSVAGYRETADQLYAMNLADGALTRLTYTPSPCTLPQFSASGQRWIYLRNAGGAYGNICKREQGDPNGVRVIPPDYFDLPPSAVSAALAPDGETIWYAMQPSERRPTPGKYVPAELHRADFAPDRRDEDDEPKIAEGSAPAVSGDGTWLAYVSPVNNPSGGVIVLRSLANGRERTLGPGRAPQFDPRRRTLLFLREYGTAERPQPQFVTCQVAENGETAIHEPGADDRQAAEDGARFLRDGRVLFSRRNDGRPLGLFVMNADRTGLRQLTTGADTYPVEVAGGVICFLRGNRVYRMAPDGTAVAALPAVPLQVHGLTAPPDGDCLILQAAPMPDGQAEQRTVSLGDSGDFADIFKEHPAEIAVYRFTYSRKWRRELDAEEHETALRALIAQYADDATAREAMRDARLLLAEVLTEDRQWEKAVAAYREIIVLYPNEQGLMLAAQAHIDEICVGHPALMTAEEREALGKKLTAQLNAQLQAKQWHEASETVSKLGEFYRADNRLLDALALYNRYIDLLLGSFKPADPATQDDGDPRNYYLAAALQADDALTLALLRAFLAANPALPAAQAGHLAQWRTALHYLPDARYQQKPSPVWVPEPGDAQKAQAYLAQTVFPALQRQLDWWQTTGKKVPRAAMPDNVPAFLAAWQQVKEQGANQAAPAACTHAFPPLPALPAEWSAPEEARRIAAVVDAMARSLPAKMDATTIRILTHIANSPLPIPAPERFLDPLVALSRAADVPLTVIAARGLGKIAGPRSNEALTALLAYPAQEVRLTAIKALGEHKDPTLLPVLLPLAEDANATIRATAAEALGKIGTEAATAILITLTGDPVFTVSRQALTALGRSKDPAALAYLQQQLPTVKPGEYSALYTGLAFNPDSKACDLVLQALNDPEVINKLQVLPVLNAFIATWPQQSNDAIIAVLQHQTGFYQERALDALRRFDDPRLPPVLMEIYDKRHDTVRVKAGLALQRTGAPAVPLIFEAMVKCDPWRVEYYAELLHGIGQPAMNYLLAAANDPDPLRRKRAMSAFAFMQDPCALPVLRRALRDLSVEVRMNAAYALNALHDEQSVDLLIAGLQDQDARVRGNCAYALRQLKAEKAVDALVAALNDDGNRSARINIVLALGELSAPKAADALRARLQTDRSDLFPNLARAAALHGGARTEALLLTCLKDDPDGGRRSSAALALAAMPTQAVVDGLQAALDDEGLTVRVDAIGALGALAATKATPPLQIDRARIVKAILAVLPQLPGCQDPRPQKVMQACLACCTPQELDDICARIFATFRDRNDKSRAADMLYYIGAPALNTVLPHLGQNFHMSWLVTAVGAELQDPRLLDACMQELGSQRSDQKAEILQIIVNQRAMRAVPAILYAMDTTRISFFNEKCGDALRTLTGMDFGNTSELWWEWLLLDYLPAHGNTLGA